MMRLMLKRWIDREEGQGMVEYALIIGLVAIGVLAFLGTMGDEVGRMFNTIVGTLQGVQ
jgi:pilus assembly protein Flp/PilA